MTQEQLAQAIGINRATLSKYESGAIDPPTSQLRTIASILGVEPWELMDSGLSPELKKFPIDSISRQFKYITDEIRALTELDLPASGIDTHKIVIAVNKIMGVNNAILHTPRLSNFFDATEAVIGLKFVLCYLKFDWHKYEYGTFEKIVDSDLLKDVLRHLLDLYAKTPQQAPQSPPPSSDGTDTTPS